MLKKILLRSLLGILLIVTSIVLLFVVANWQDQSLRPEVQASLNWQPPKNIDDDNGYLILLGMNAKDGVDPLDLGKRILESELARYDREKNLMLDDATIDNVHPESQTFRKLDGEICDYTRTPNCVQFYLSRTVEQEQEILQSRKAILANFVMIQASRDYQEIVPPFIAANIPSFGALLHAMELERMKAIRLIEQGKTDQGFSELMKLAAYSQRWMENNSSLISHLLATVTVQRDLRIVDELLQRYPELIHEQAHIQAWLGRFSEKKMSIGRALDLETSVNLRTMHSIRLESVAAQSSVWQKFLIDLFNRPNASLNLTYDWHQMWSALAERSGRGYLIHREEVQGKQDALLGFGVSNFYLLDPITKILLGVSTPSYETYIEKHFDTFAQINLLAMKMALIEKKIASSAIPQFVQDHTKQYANPYDGKAIGWDAEKHQLFIEIRQESDQLYQKVKILRLDVPRFTSAVGT